MSPATILNSTLYKFHMSVCITNTDDMLHVMPTYILIQSYQLR